MSISTLNDDLNILQNLAIPAFEEDVDVIQKLDDEPNDVGGLTAAELKAKFDEAGNRIKTYLNETLVPSISETVAEAEERAEAEAARVLAEEQRVTAEQARVSSEAEREQAEAERRASEADRAAAEAARKTAEDARVLAEQNRVDTDSGIVAQATSAAEAAENAANKAASAAIHQPIVGDNGNWHTWSFDAGAYVDTGIYAGGDAPYIGENGKRTAAAAQASPIREHSRAMTAPHLTLGRTETGMWARLTRVFPPLRPVFTLAVGICRMDITCKSTRRGRKPILFRISAPTGTGSLGTPTLMCRQSDPPGRLVRLALLAQQGPKVPRGKSGHRGHKVKQAHKDLKEFKAYKVNKALKVNKVLED